MNNAFGNFQNSQNNVFNQPQMQQNNGYGQGQNMQNNIHNNADDLWGAIADINNNAEQEQKAKEEQERLAKEAEEKKKAADAEKNKPFSDPFGDLIGGIDGIKPSNDLMPQQQQQQAPQQQRNSMLGSLGTGFQQMNMQQHA